MKLPLEIIMDADVDKIVEWADENQAVMHRSTMTAVSVMLLDETLEDISVICFYRDKRSVKPFAEIIMHREDVAESLQIALNFFVQGEMYEEV